MIRLLATVVLLGAMAHCFGCSSAPLERQELDELRGRPALPFAVKVSLGCDAGLEGFGNVEEWRKEIARALKDLAVCQAIVPEDSVSEDLTVVIGVHRAGDAQEAEIIPEGAFLDFLLWSTIPFAPLWVSDVSQDPGISASLSLSSRGQDASKLPPSELPCQPLKTCHLDRHPFLSWPTLGGILLPPFVFNGVDRDHFEDTVAPRAREEVAALVARKIKETWPLEKELLRELRLQRRPGGWMLRFREPPHETVLYKVTVSLELEGGADGSGTGSSGPTPLRATFPEFPLASGKNRVILLPVDLLCREAGQRSAWLRIEAVDRKARVSTYTLRWPPDR